MKKTVFIIILLVTIVTIFVLITANKVDRDDYLRIHIRANSNEKVDQDVKYEIKGEVVRLLSPLLDEVQTKEEAKQIVLDNMQNIENVANKVLSSKGYPYRAKCDIRREKFPIRHYGNLTLEKGVYDALIVELGEAKGDNWWCVVFPPLCFVESENIGSGKFTYVSKIAEWIQKIRDNK